MREIDEKLFAEVARDGATAESVQKLIDDGADVNASDDGGRTALMEDTTLDISKVLINAGANVNAKNNNGYTTLKCARSPEMAEMLIKAGADVNARDDYGRTMLMITWDPRMVEILTKAGADVNEKDHSGNTALMIIMDLEKIKMLIKAGADVNAKNNGGKTALMCCDHLTIINFIYADVAKVLIEAGADLKDFNPSNNFLKKLLRLPDNKIACDKLLHYKFGALDSQQFLKKASELKGEDLQQLFALKFKHFLTAEKIASNIIPKLKEFHDVAVEMKYQEGKIFDLFTEYLDALKNNNAALNASKDGLKIPGLSDDLMHKISGISEDIVKIHKAIIEKNSAPKIQENFFKAIDDFAHKYDDIDKKHQDKMKEYTKAHIEGAPLSERNHDFFIKLSKAAGHEEAHAESDWKSLVEHNDHVEFAHKIDDAIHDYIIGHKGSFPPDVLC
jgi:hypothetical protein